MDATPIAPRSRAAREAACEMPPALIDEMVLPTVQAAKLCGYSTVGWRKLVKAGKTPKPVRLSARRLGWRTGDLRSWLKAKEDDGREAS